MVGVGHETEKEEPDANFRSTSYRRRGRTYRKRTWIIALFTRFVRVGSALYVRRSQLLRAYWRNLNWRR